MAEKDKSPEEETEVIVEPEEEEGQQEQEAAPQKEEDEDVKYKAKTEKRIKELLSQRKEADRRAQEAELGRRNLEQRIQELEKTSRKAEDLAIEKFHEGAQVALDAAKRDFRAAYEAGDPEALADAQVRVSEATVAVREAQRAKSNVAQRPAPSQNAFAAPRQQGPEPKALEWAERNSGWFNKDEVTTAAAYAIDYKLKNEGYDPTGDEYWHELDKRLADTFPTKFERPGASSPVAPVSGRGAARNRQVKLTPGEAEMAGRLGVSLEDYAREKVNPGSSIK